MLETVREYLQQDDGTDVISGITGDGIVIAILDGKPDFEHLSLKMQGKRHPSSDGFIGKYTVDSVMAPQFIPKLILTHDQHGTAVAAVAGGVRFKSNFGEDIPDGIAPYAKLLICEVFHNKQLYNVNQALEYLLKLVMVEKVQIDIICMPFAMERRPEVESLLSHLASAGVVCVAAAGNDGDNQAGAAFPASDIHVLSVGALTPGSKKNSDLNQSQGIDVYAHGEQIAIPLVDSNRLCFSAMTKDDGSSYAAPMVAGFLALLMQCVKNQGANSDVIRKYHDINFLKWLFNDYRLCEQQKLVRASTFLKQLCSGKLSADQLVEEYYSYKTN